MSANTPAWKGAANAPRASGNTGGLNSHAPGTPSSRASTDADPNLGSARPRRACSPDRSGATPILATCRDPYPAWSPRERPRE
ncbi:hypothetical protein GCM10023199_27540 [Actinomycetospora chibensis]